MAQARSSLSSVIHGVEGVPLPSSVIPQRNALAGVSESPKGNFVGLGAPASPRKAFILRFSDGLFLHGYRSDGISVVGDLQQAKLFSTPPISDAHVFHAEVRTVLVNIDGSCVRRTLLRVPTGAPRQFTAAK